MAVRLARQMVNGKGVGGYEFEVYSDPAANKKTYQKGLPMKPA